LESSIGIFDSGIGGLTVFREIQKLLPDENLIYLGDTARVPYGTKSPETVTRYATQNIRFLLDQKVKMIVVACNTASAFALSAVQDKYDIPILGVIEPGVKKAVAAGGRIGVIGTEGTVVSNAYEKAILQREPKAIVASQACPLFVPLAEEGMVEGEIVELIARRYLENLAGKIDTLILGCTHYPLLKKPIQKVAGNVSLIDSAEATAYEVALLLKQKNLFKKSSEKAERRFFVTDSPERFRKVGEFFLQTPIDNVQHIEI
jgi:glutamate racemase